MPVFKTFFKISLKRANAIFIYFAIYIFLTVALAFNGQDEYIGHFQASALHIAISDEDNSAGSAALCDYLSSIHTVTDISGDKESLFDRMYYRTLDYALTIPKGFEADLCAGGKESLVSSAKIPGSTQGNYVDQQIAQYISFLQLYILSGDSLTDAVAQTDAALKSIPEVQTVSFHTDTGSTDSTAFYFFQYLPYVFLVILFCGLAPVLVTLNSFGIRARTACASLSSGQRYRELAAGCIIYGLGVWLVFFLLSAILYNGEIFTTNCLLALLNSFILLLFCVAATLLISCFAPDDSTLNLVANIVGLSMSFLCGVFVPQQILPASVLNAARFLPAYWYIRANNMLGGFGKEVFDMGFYWQCIGIQILFTAAFFTVSFAAARFRRRKN